MLERFTDEEVIHLQAYEKLYGPIGDRRYDYLFARLGMDVVAPHLKKGRRTTLDDHIVKWSSEPKKQQTPEEMLRTAQQIQAVFDQQARRGKHRTRP